MSFGPAAMDEADGCQQEHEQQDLEIALQGHWCHPGKKTQEIALLANKRVRFGVADESSGGFWFEFSVLEDPMPSIVIGFHDTNIDTNDMCVHQLFFEQCGVYLTKKSSIALILVVAIPASFPVVDDPHEGLASNAHWEAKVTLKWFHPGKAVAFVYLMHNNQILFHEGTQLTPAHGYWTFERKAGVDRFVTWFHHRGKVDELGRPKSSPTVLRRVTSPNAFCTNIFRAESTAVLTENGQYTVVEVADWDIASWHIVAQIVPRKDAEQMKA